MNSKDHNLKVYSYIRSNGDWHSFEMMLLEEVPYVDKITSLKRERYWLDVYQANLNSVIPSRTGKQYYQDNVDHIKQYGKQYQEDHIKQRKKQYQEDCVFICRSRNVNCWNYFNLDHNP